MIITLNKVNRSNKNNMTNWKKYTITDINNTSSTSWVKFDLSDYVDYSSGRERYVYCVNSHPFNSFRKWDEIEIDLDRTKYRGSTEDVDSIGILRKYGSDNSMSVVPASIRRHPIVSRLESSGSSTARQVGGQLISQNQSGEYVSVRANLGTGEYHAEIVQYDPKTKDFYYSSDRRPQ